MKPSMGRSYGLGDDATDSHRPIGREAKPVARLRR